MKEHEQVEIGEEARVSLLVLHVSNSVNMNQRPDAGDDHEHDHREPVDRVVPSDIERARRHPGVVMFDDRSVEGG